MANAAEHMTVAGGATAITYLAMCRRFNRQPRLDEAVLCTGIGIFSGIAPDLLEPALHPNHRQFFHSLTAGGAIVATGSQLCGRENLKLDEFTKVLAACAVVGYVCHLLLDGSTPKGLPLLGK